MENCLNEDVKFEDLNIEEWNAPAYLQSITPDYN